MDYKIFAKSYKELYGEEQRRKYRIVASLLKDKINKDTKILDVGAGIGLAREFFGKVYALEPENALLKQAKDVIKVKAKAEDIPFSNDYFDIVISVTAIHNFENIEKGIKEMKRVGKKYFVFTILKKTSKKEKIFKSIKENFKIIKVIDEGKDLIFYLEK